MKIMLIADSGSTKTDWIKITKKTDGKFETKTYSCLGLNPVHIDEKGIEKELWLVCQYLGKDFDTIRFYGAGVGNVRMKRMIEGCLSRVFKCSDIAADSDIAGAARAVLGDKSGIACIMGTGSNSCHYDGEKIDRKMVSLGYILDDNGGGVAFGKQLLSDIFKGIAPEEIRMSFCKKYNLSASDVIEHMYRQPATNRWLASFMPFVMEHKTHPYISTMITTRLQYFFDREFNSYTENQLKEEGIGFVGSVASLLSEEISMILEMRGWKMRDIISKPLAQYKKWIIKEENEY